MKPTSLGLTSSRSVFGKLDFTMVMQILIAGIFIVFSFWNGLYFDDSFMRTAVYWSATVIIFIAWLRVSKIKIRNLLLVDYLVISYFIVFCLSALWPANMELAVLGLVRGISYLFLYLIVRLLTSMDAKKNILINFLILSGVIFALYGLANGFGTLNVNGTIFDPRLRRLAANFEYPNTFAIYQAIMFLLSVVMRSIEHNKLKKYLYSALSYILLVTVLLTYSRGTWLVLAGMVILLLLLLPKGTKGGIALQLFLPLMMLLVTSPFLSKATAQTNGTLGWGILAIGVVGVFFLNWVIFVMRKRVSTQTWKTGVMVSVIVLAIIAVIGSLKLGIAQNIIQRFQAISVDQFSVVQRVTFYKDGLKVLREHPILGAGPDAWAALYQRYQSYPYVSRQSHSFFIDTIMSNGLLGILILLVALVVAIWTGLRFYRSVDTENRIVGSTIICALIGLLAHGAIDFDFAYGAINFLFWLLVALSLPKLSVKSRDKVLTKTQTSNWERTIMTVGFVFTFAIGIVASGYLLSNYYLSKATLQNKSPEEALGQAQNAIAVAPYRANSWLIQVKFEDLIYKIKNEKEMPAKIKSSAERAISLAPHDPEILRQANEYVGKYGGGLQTIEIARRSWENGRYKMQYPEQYIVLLDSAGTQFYRKDRSQAKEFFNSALETYHNVEARIEGFKLLPPTLSLEYKYDITSAMRLNAAESAYYIGQYDIAQNILEPLLKSENPKEQAKAKVVNAAIQGKLGKPIDISVFALVARDKQLDQYYIYLNNIEPLK